MRYGTRRPWWSTPEGGADSLPLRRADGNAGRGDHWRERCGDQLRLGARGIDFIERVGASTVTGFPIYDAHGNNVATLTQSETTYSIGDQRSYDASGGGRAQQNAGDPKLRYSANLGHKQDDESGLIYMRAR